MVAQDQTDRSRGCLLGLAVGDAVGTTVEFQPRGSFEPLTDLVGGGPFDLPAGAWTDDTAMALCLGVSLREVGGFNPQDQMQRYCEWWQQGYLSSTGVCFDIGNTVQSALRGYQQTGDPLAGSTHPRSAGNGSIMRLAPVPLFYYPDRLKILQFSAESSRTTHGAAVCLDACRVLGEALYWALSGAEKAEILARMSEMVLETPEVMAIARGEYQRKPIAAIRGSGYVVESLEAALWCFWATGSYREAVLAAANLGDDADTTAAICGQIAGAFYGESGIPEAWLACLVMRSEIAELAEALGQAVPSAEI
ncbi:MAG: ADP-ribosylglycohydrolase family protein [Prochlorothrix sp.]|nr:ADP-ribosylglycohydrolase family protein [Prochlorothrix sp.]